MINWKLGISCFMQHLHIASAGMHFVIIPSSLLIHATSHLLALVALTTRRALAATNPT